MNRKIDSLIKESKHVCDKRYTTTMLKREYDLGNIAEVCKLLRTKMFLNPHFGKSYLLEKSCTDDTVEVVKTFLDCNYINVEMDGVIYLNKSIEFNSFKVCKLLLEQRSLNLDSDRIHILMSCIYNNRYITTRLLFESGKINLEHGNFLIVLVVKYCNHDMLKLFLNTNLFNISYINHQAIRLAYDMKKFKCVKVLLDRYIQTENKDLIHVLETYSRL